MTMDNFEETSMKEMMEAFDKGILKIQSGDIVKGKVISVTEDEVFVNIGYMSDGVITKEEVSDEEGINLKDILKPEDEIEVYILEVNDGEGNIALSKKRVDAFKIWDDFEASLKAGTSFEVKVSEVVKGGVVAYIKGIRAFIPASQISTSYVEDLNQWLGKALIVKVIELDKEKKKVVLSGKEVEKAEKESKKDEVWATLKKGEKRKGQVSRLTKFGAFVDLGGIDGLIHISHLSWKKVKDPSEVVTVGDWVDVYVLDFDKAKERISLDLKEVSMNPWNNIFSKYHIGDVVEGTVVKLLDFGAFVELEGGLEGLVHISQISEERISKPSAVLKIEDKVKVKILDINENEQRISLSIKEAAEKEVEDFSGYTAPQEEKTTLGDLFKDKLKGFKFEE